MFVSVKFNPRDFRTYTYTYDGDQPLRPGDLVKVETKDGTKTVTVAAVDVKEPAFACKPIVSVLSEGGGLIMADGANAGMGHNKGPVFNTEVVDAFAAEATEIADAASEWANVEITTETKAGELKDFLDTARAKLKEIEERRKIEKQPFLDAGRDVDTAFNRVKDIIEKAGKLAKGPLEAYLKEQQRIAEERRRAEQEAARKAAEEAERERMIAERNRNAAAMVEAEEKAKEAAEAAKAAEAAARAKVSSATGTGSKSTSLRTVRYAQITNINQAMLHYRGHADLAECITRLANADIRAAKGAAITIPGIEIIEEQKL